MSAAELMEPNFDVDKVSYEIFSILESKFLFSTAANTNANAPAPPAKPPASTGRVRILSVDAGGATDGLLAAASLAHLESSLNKLSGASSARVADFFDVAAGSGVGGILVALLFTRGAGGRPLLSAAEALEFLARNRQALQRTRKKRSGIAAIFRRKSGGGSSDQILRQVLGEATLRDTLKPVLVPCYDLATRAPFLFSRADAMEAEGYNFLMREVCVATLGSVRVRSLNGSRSIAAVDGGVAAGNPAAAAITHVLNNRGEFPSVSGMDDLLLVSLGNGELAAAITPPCGLRGERPCASSSSSSSPSPSPSEIVQIAREGASDMVDQSVAMAFGEKRTTNYVRIQARVFDCRKFQSPSAAELRVVARELLAQKSIESVLFQGKAVAERINAEKLERVSAELLREHEDRKSRPHPVVVLKQGSPRSSSCSALSLRSESPDPDTSPR